MTVVPFATVGGIACILVAFIPADKGSSIANFLQIYLKI